MKCWKTVWVALCTPQSLKASAPSAAPRRSCRLGGCRWGCGKRRAGMGRTSTALGRESTLCPFFRSLST